MKALNIIKNVLVGAVVVLAVCMTVFTVVSVATFDRTERNLFGYKPLIILSDSMSATDFAAGDLVLVKETDPSTLSEGDIIAYTSQNSASYGETVTHKIRSVTTNEAGEPGFITYGTTTDTDDETVVTYPYVLGKYVGRFEGVGNFFYFLKSVPGYFICIFAPFMLLIAYQAAQCVKLFRQYRDEREQELASAQERVESEHEETLRMMREIAALKAQIERDKQTLQKDPAAPHDV